MGMGREKTRGVSGEQRGAVLAHGVLRGTRGQQGPAAATAAGCSGSSEASAWGPAWGNPRSCLGGASPRPAWGEHPSPSSVLLLEPPLHLTCAGDAQSQLSHTSPHFLGPLTLVPGWIQQWLPMLWSRAELHPTSAHGATGVHWGRAPTLGHSISLQRFLGGDQAWHVHGVAVPASGVFRQESVPVSRVRAVACRCF